MQTDERHRELRISDVAQAEAERLGFLYPQDAAKLMDRSRIEIDDDGRIDGIREAVARLARDRPGFLAGANPPRIEAFDDHAFDDPHPAPPEYTVDTRDALLRSGRYTAM